MWIVLITQVVIMIFWLAPVGGYNPIICSTDNWILIFKSEKPLIKS